jgi:hypothetical protein
MIMEALKVNTTLRVLELSGQISSKLADFIAETMKERQTKIKLAERKKKNSATVAKVSANNNNDNKMNKNSTENNIDIIRYSDNLTSSSESTSIYYTKEPLSGQPPTILGEYVDASQTLFGGSGSDIAQKQSDTVQSLGLQKNENSSLYLKNITKGNKLGSGSFGEVWLGHTNDGDVVALKSLKYEDIKTIEKEAEILK